MPYQQILQKYAYQGIFACRIHICDENVQKQFKILFFEIFTVKNAKKQKND